MRHVPVGCSRTPSMVLVYDSIDWSNVTFLIVVSVGDLLTMVFVEIDSVVRLCARKVRDNWFILAPILYWYVY